MLYNVPMTASAKFFQKGGVVHSCETGDAPAFLRQVLNAAASAELARLRARWA